MSDFQFFGAGSHGDSRVSNLAEQFPVFVGSESVDLIRRCCLLEHGGVSRQNRFVLFYPFSDAIKRPRASANLLHQLVEFFAAFDTRHAQLLESLAAAHRVLVKRVTDLVQGIRLLLTPSRYLKGSLCRSEFFELGNRIINRQILINQRGRGGFGAATEVDERSGNKPGHSDKADRTAQERQQSAAGCCEHRCRLGSG